MQSFSWNYSIKIAAITYDLLGFKLDSALNHHLTSQ